MKHLLVCIFLIFSLGLVMADSENQPTPKHIGSAKMEANGNILLRLRAEAEDGSIGDAMFRYSPDSPEYTDILRHLGGLKPGESKLVPPWPDKDKQ